MSMRANVLVPEILDLVPFPLDLDTDLDTNIVLYFSNVIIDQIT